MCSRNQRKQRSCEIRFENTKDSCWGWNGAIRVNNIFKEIGSDDAELTGILKVGE